MLWIENRDDADANGEVMGQERMDSGSNETARSCYIVEFSVPPGGARLGLLFAYPSLNHVRSCLDQLFLNGSEPADFNRELLDEDDDAILRLWIVQRGLAAGRIDLRPLLPDHSHPDLDWHAITAVSPPLEGHPIDAAGVTVRVQGTSDDGFTYLEDGLRLSPGFNDVEGDDEPPPEFQDPWHPRH